MIQVDLFTTMPQSVHCDGHRFSEEIRRIAEESENNGFKGTLVYSDNRLADPWIVTEAVLRHTRKLIPMIALQPVYMHPYTVAKKVATLALMHKRMIAFNLIAGGFKNDLLALGDHTDHDRRYDRLYEYSKIIQLLLKSDQPVTFEGEFYQVKNLKLQPEMPSELYPLIYLSGSSDAAKSTADRLQAKLIEYPEWVKPVNDNGYGSIPKSMKPVSGIRVGILTRKSHQTAWQEAKERFPETRLGEITHQLANKITDSEWHKTLSDQARKMDSEEPVYWLGPFKHYHTFCPYLTGSYQEVSDELSKYLNSGCRTCVIDIPVSNEELKHTRKVFELALEKAGLNV
jgi:alkanesulfonate monooxygenase